MYSILLYYHTNPNCTCLATKASYCSITEHFDNLDDLILRLAFIKGNLQIAIKNKVYKYASITCFNMDAEIEIDVIYSADYSEGHANNSLVERTNTL